MSENVLRRFRHDKEFFIRAVGLPAWLTLCSPGDVENVKKVREGYKVQTLSAFLNQTAPPAGPAVQFLKPPTLEAGSDVPFYRTDGNGEALDASKHRYTLRFEPGKLPPAHAFWSVTMYGLPESLLVANPINRYLINSPMLPHLKQDTDGGLTLYIQPDSPGKAGEANWLPAPNGSFWVAMRIYWPEQAALDGTWRQPLMPAVK